jgi:hypothetical protein
VRADPGNFLSEAEHLSRRHLLNALENALNPLLHVSGSISTLNEDLIPEAADGFSTVKKWAFDVLYTLNPSRDELQGEFFTNLCKAFTLGRLQQDGRTVDDCLRRIPSTTSQKQRHPRLIVHLQFGKQIYTLYDFLAFMDGSGDLRQGIKFFRCVLSVSPQSAPLRTPLRQFFGPGAHPCRPCSVMHHCGKVVRACHHDCKT